MKAKTSHQILDFLSKSHHPVLATELVEVFSAKNKTTVYRQLKNLEDRGLITSFVSGLEAKTYYELRTDHNCHFECQACGIILCMNSQSKSLTPQELPGVIWSAQFKGICQACLSKAGESSHSTNFSKSTISTM